MNPFDMEITMKRLIPIVFVLLACSYPDIKLTKAYLYENGVQSPIGQVTAELQKGKTLSNYSDSLISINWYPGYKGIFLELSNKTDYLGTIIWDDATYWDTDSSCSRIVHYGVAYINREQEQSQNKVLPRAKIKDIIVPSKNISFGAYGWTETPLSNPYQQKNQLIKLYFPYEINSITRNYIFEFTIEGLNTNEKSGHSFIGLGPAKKGEDDK
jgi:hypothetical protein